MLLRSLAVALVALAPFGPALASEVQFHVCAAGQNLGEAYARTQFFNGLLGPDQSAQVALDLANAAANIEVAEAGVQPPFSTSPERQRSVSELLGKLAAYASNAEGRSPEARMSMIQGFYTHYLNALAMTYVSSRPDAFQWTSTCDSAMLEANWHLGRAGTYAAVRFERGRVEETQARSAQGGANGSAYQAIRKGLSLAVDGISPPPLVACFFNTERAWSVVPMLRPDEPQPTYVELLPKVLEVCRSAGPQHAPGTHVTVPPVVGFALADTRGEVTAVEGTVLVLAVRSGPAPVLGDVVSVMRPLDAGGNATPVGTWRVTEVQGVSVRAVREESFGGPPEVGMPAVFKSPRGTGFREGPDVYVPGAARSGVPGRVTQVRGREVTVRLDGEAVAVVGDEVELSFRVGEETISVGTWRVSRVLADGRLKAAAVEALAEPTTAMDALVQATGSRADGLFRRGMEVLSKDPARSVGLFVEAAGLGHAGAAERAGRAFMNGEGVPRDDARAVPLLRQAAEAGRPSAQNDYAVFFAAGRGGVARDDAEAVKWYRKAAAQGEPMAQANLCVCYQDGIGVPRDLAEALRLCRLSAEKGNAIALDRLGWSYQNGLGVEKDLGQAFRYYLRSAEAGNANGQNNVGSLYENGWGVERDYGQALSWYRKAAGQGWAWAEWNLGRMLETGMGVPQDRATAVAHFRRAARAGHAQSQEKLRQLGESW